MKEDRRLGLPPMAMLHSFAAAVRHGSFTRAAAEVGLTQSAISRQIAGLEQWLGQALFDRLGRRVRLNQAGQDYARAIAPALNQIRAATEAALFTEQQTHTIELAALPGFATRWLAPRLASLRKAVPGIVLNVIARSDEFDFSCEHFTAAIHYGSPSWPNVEHRFLFRERCVAVLSPELLARGNVTTPADLLKLPLLAQSWRSDAWTLWARASGLAASPESVSTFSDFMTLAEAAVAGAGAALLPSFLVRQELDSGKLVSPFALALQDEKAYYCVFPADRCRTPRFLRFLAWLEDQCEREREPSIDGRSISTGIVRKQRGEGWSKSLCSTSSKRRSSRKRPFS